MRLRERLLRAYSDADWIAHLLLSTLIAAAINLFDILSQSIAEAQAAGTHDVDGFEITVCYFGPPTPFYPRLIVLAALSISTPAAFKRSASCRLISSVGLASAMSIYVFWWLASYRQFRNVEELAGIHFLNHPEIKQFAYLYEGTSFDLAVALSTAVCLVIMLDRLFDRP